MAIEGGQGRRQHSIFVLTGIITTKRNHDSFMQTRMDAFKKEVFGDTPKPVIFHRREIIIARGPSRYLRTRRSGLNLMSVFSSTWKSKTTLSSRS